MFQSTRSVTSPRKKKAKMMRNIKMKTKIKMTKGALLAAVFSVLVMGGNASLITPADASTDPVVEAVAVV